MAALFFWFKYNTNTTQQKQETLIHQRLIGHIRPRPPVSYSWNKQEIKSS